MKKIIAILAVLLIASGCSHQRSTLEHTPPSKKEIKDPKLFVVNPEIPQPDPSNTGAVKGEIFLERFKEQKGNLFIYIIDDTKMPQEIVTIAAAVYPQPAIQTDKLEFELRNVPAGTRQIIVVWDTSEPFCSLTVPYCASSPRDGLGQSPPVEIKPGRIIKDVQIDVF